MEVGERAVSGGDEHAEAGKALDLVRPQHAEILQGGDKGEYADEPKVGGWNHACEDRGNDPPQEKRAESPAKEYGGFAGGWFRAFDFHWLPRCKTGAEAVANLSRDFY
jgi:hypothetical protein